MFNQRKRKACRVYHLWLKGWPYEAIAQKFHIKEDEIPFYLVLHGEYVQKEKGYVK